MTNEELAHLAQQGDEEAKEILLTKNRRFCYHVAKTYAKTQSELEEYASIALVGMVKAMNTFDITKKIKFATYAARIMHNEILMYLRKVNRWSVEVSYEEALSEDKDGNEFTIFDVLSAKESEDIDNFVDMESFKEILDKTILTLDEKERKVLYLRFYKNMTQQEAASEIGVSRSYVARLTQKVIEKLRKVAIKEGFIDRPATFQEQRVVYHRSSLPSPINQNKKEETEVPKIDFNEFAYVWETYKPSISQLKKLFNVQDGTVVYHKKKIESGQYKPNFDLVDKEKWDKLVKEMFGLKPVNEQSKQEAVNVVNVVKVEENPAITPTKGKTLETTNPTGTAKATLQVFNVRLTNADVEHVDNVLTALKALVSGNSQYEIEISVVKAGA